jgi:hypothetical protein
LLFFIMDPRQLWSTLDGADFRIREVAAAPARGLSVCLEHTFRRPGAERRISEIRDAVLFSIMDTAAQQPLARTPFLLTAMAVCADRTVSVPVYSMANPTAADSKALLESRSRPNCTISARFPAASTVRVDGVTPMGKSNPDRSVKGRPLPIRSIRCLPLP